MDNSDKEFFAAHFLVSAGFIVIVLIIASFEYEYRIGFGIKLYYPLWEALQDLNYFIPILFSLLFLAFSLAVLSYKEFLERNMTKIVGISGLSGLLLGLSFILLILGEVLQSIRIIFLSLILLSTSNIVLSISFFLYSFYARKENVGWIGSFLSLMGTLGFAGFLLMFFVLGFGWILMGISIYFWKGALPSSNPPVDTGRMEISFDVIAYLLLVAFLPLLIFLSNLRILLAFIFAAFLSLIMKMRDKRLNYVFFISLGISSVISLTYLRQSYRTWLIATLLDTRHLFYSKLNEFYEVRAFNVPLTQIAAEHLFILFLIPFVFYFFTKIRIHDIDLRQTKLASIFLLSLIYIFPVFFFVFVEHLKATYGLVLSILLLPFLTIYYWREKSFTEILKIFIIVYLFYSTVIVYNSYPNREGIYFNQSIRELAIDKSIEILEKYRSYVLEYDYRTDLQSTSIFTPTSWTYFCSIMAMDGESVVICSYFTRTVYAIIRPYVAVILHHTNATSPLIVFIQAGFLIKRLITEKVETSMKMSLIKIDFENFSHVSRKAKIEKVSSSEIECLYVYNLINKTRIPQNFTGGAYKVEVEIIQQVKEIARGKKNVPLNITFTFSGKLGINIDEEGNISGWGNSYGYRVITRWRRTYLSSSDYIFDRLYPREWASPLPRNICCRSTGNP